LISCSGAPRASGSTGSAVLTGTELAGKEWKLTEVRINDVNTGFSRNDLARIGYSESFFTLTFNAETVYGIVAPNNYGAPYTLQAGSQISISMMISTEMAPLFELDTLREFDYFNYLQNAASWNLANNNLVLNSKAADGKAVTLIFGL
jgi:heat shock protein HslJ